MKSDLNGGVMQAGELTYNHTNETQRLRERATRFTRIEYNNLCDSSERQATVKRLLTRNSSLYESQPLSSNSARAICSRSRLRESATL